MATSSVRRTRQRTAVADALAAEPSFRTAQQVHGLLADRGESVALATVYRHLQAMLAAGEIDAIRTDDGQLAYRRCADSGHHHHHLVCRSCGHAVEVEFGPCESAVAEIATANSFTAVAHELELFGLCERCSL